MLLWIVVALGFVICVVILHLLQGITMGETCFLFVASTLIFAADLRYIYKIATTDQYLLSGYVTSVIHRDAFSYRCGKRTCHEPERWILEQRPERASRNVTVDRSLHGGDGTERCIGECLHSFPAPYDTETFDQGANYVYTILVDPSKWQETRLNEPSALWHPYFNPVKVSDEVVYNRGEEIPYFEIVNYNNPKRLITPSGRHAYSESLEELNAKLAPYNISVGLVITPEKMYFESLKRAWYQGKPNDFVVVVNLTGNVIRNVNVLGWNNYELKENVARNIMLLPSVNLEDIVSAIEKGLSAGPAFAVTDLSRYSYLNVKIPPELYVRIILYQLAYFAYMILLLNFNPNTKDRKLTWSEVNMLWDKHYTPPSLRWYLHPFAPYGFIFYILIPVLIFGAFLK